MKRKVLSFTIALVAVVTAISQVTASASSAGTRSIMDLSAGSSSASGVAEHKEGEEFTVGKLRYRIYGKNALSVVGTSDSEIGILVIPDRVEYGGNVYNVVRIETIAFNKCTNLFSVSIPATVEYVAGLAFKDCVNLRNVNFNGSVVVGSFAFYKCHNLTVTFAERFYIKSNGLPKDTAIICN